MAKIVEPEIELTREETKALARRVFLDLGKLAKSPWVMKEYGWWLNEAGAICRKLMNRL